MARKIWYKFRKWLKYKPEKYYMRGNSDKNSDGNNNNVDAKLAISTISRVYISRHGDMRVVQSNNDR
jgi:hypothetical protein|tara:strand:- start:424 stop:624 length:201 start_codon:yes stop_codon:yes gene_type:complete